MKFYLPLVAAMALLAAVAATDDHSALRGGDEDIARVLKKKKNFLFRKAAKKENKNKKVDVCHIPPGNPDNWHTINISENAVAKHIEKHGDFLGKCDDWCDELCGNENLCITLGECEANGCDEATSTEVECIDGVDCTDDSCIPATGCVFTPNDDNCDDGNACTIGSCDLNADCQYVDRVCDDGVDCTDDSCDSETGCVFAPDDDNCDDGDACTIGSCDLNADCQYEDIVLKKYTTSADFELGSKVNVDSMPVADQLQLDNVATPFNFIWIANSARGTVVKVDTLTGTILGEYRTSPGTGTASPSRTTVDNDGSVWVANRVGVGGVVHIGLFENGQCEDRNNNGQIDTSTGLADIRTWTDVIGPPRNVGTAEDECIVSYTAVSSTGTRHLSVTQQNDVWVSGTGNRNWDKIKGGNVNDGDPFAGTIINNYPSVGFGGYGGLEDANGVIWSARNLLRWDTSLPLTGPNGDPGGNAIGPPLGGANWSGQGGDSYGLCLDKFGNVWNTQLNGPNTGTPATSGAINKYAADGTYLGTFFHGDNNAQGCVADSNGDIWVAHSLNSKTTVGHLDNAGNFLGNVVLTGTDNLPLGNGPTGVAVDGAGKVWSANINSNTLSRIDPAQNGGVGAVDLTVNLGAGAGPYNYGDMTGSTLIAPPNSGSWTVVYDSGDPLKEWGALDWNELIPDESAELSVTASSSTDNLSFSAPESVTKSTDLTVTPDGQYLKVVVSFTRATTVAPPDDTTPILYDLTVLCT